MRIPRLSTIASLSKALLVAAALLAGIAVVVPAGIVGTGAVSGGIQGTGATPGGIVGTGAVSGGIQGTGAISDGIEGTG
jgi:hypothetical protein